MSKTLLQRLIFSGEKAPNLMPLYAEGQLLPDKSAKHPEFTDYGRTWATLSARQYVSFATYFNAFAASYWANYTKVKSVTLEVKAHGTGRLSVFRSSPKGDSHRIESLSVSGEVEHEFALSLADFSEGGWYWLEAEADSEEMTIDYANWFTNEPAVKSDPKITIAITTFNRSADCVRSMRQIADSDAVAPVLKSLVVVDQGNQKVRDEAEFVSVSADLGDKLNLVEQANLGGSGGFSRGMYESLHNDSDYVILLDDDVRLEPEGIARAATFSAFCPKDTIVGGHMFSLRERTLLHAFAEAVELERFWWGPISKKLGAHDFAYKPLRTSPQLHELAVGNYNGWWMCMIPTSTIRKIGLSLPFFIKWDDSEFGLRAAQAGIPTVSLPGVAVWHVPWTEKDDSLDWQAYFHQRNRLVAALLHSPTKNGGDLIKHSFLTDLRHLLSQQYSVVALRHKAMRDVLSGSSHLHSQLHRVVPDVRKLQSEFVDAQISSSAADFPPVDTTLTPTVTFTRNKLHRLELFAKGMLKSMLPVKESSRRNPQMELKSSQTDWAVLSQLDSVLVSSKDGSAVSFYQRDPKLFKQMLKDSLSLHRKYRAQWGNLGKYYRKAAPSLVSESAWKQTLGLDSDS